MARKKPAARAAARVRQYGPNYFAESVPVRQTLRNDAFLHIASTTIPTPGTFIIHLRKATKRYEPYSVVVDKEGYFLLFHDTAEGRWQLDRCRRELGGVRLENHIISFDPLKETTAECAVNHDVIQTDNQRQLIPAASLTKEVLPLPPTINNLDLFRPPPEDEASVATPPLINLVNEYTRVDVMESPLMDNDPDLFRPCSDDEDILMTTPSFLATQTSNAAVTPTSFATVEPVQSTAANETAPIALNELEPPSNSAERALPKNIQSRVLHRWDNGMSIDRGPLHCCGTESEAKLRAAYADQNFHDHSMFSETQDDVLLITCCDHPDTPFYAIGWMAFYKTYEPVQVVRALQRPESVHTDLNVLGASNVCTADIIDNPDAMITAASIFALNAYVIVGDYRLVEDAFLDKSKCPDYPSLQRTKIAGPNDAQIMEQPWSWTLAWASKGGLIGQAPLPKTIKIQAQIEVNCRICARFHSYSPNVMRLAMLATGRITTSQWHTMAFYGADTSHLCGKADSFNPAFGTIEDRRTNAARKIHHREASLYGETCNDPTHDPPCRTDVAERYFNYAKFLKEQWAENHTAYQRRHREIEELSSDGKSPNARVSCPVCKETLKSQLSLERHQKHNKTCVQKRTVTEASSDAELSSGGKSTLSRLRCQTCKRTFPSQYSLGRHQKRSKACARKRAKLTSKAAALTTTAAVPTFFTDLTTVLEAPSDAELSSDGNSPNGRVSCPVCKKTLKSQLSLERHQKHNKECVQKRTVIEAPNDAELGSGEKSTLSRVTCQTCKRTFPSQYSLGRHQKRSKRCVWKRSKLTSDAAALTSVTTAAVPTFFTDLTTVIEAPSDSISITTGHNLNFRGQVGQVVYDLQSGRKVLLQDSSLQTLAPGVCLNDEVVNFFMQVVLDGYSQHSTNGIYLFDTLFYAALAKGASAVTMSDYTRVAGWTKSIDMRSYEYLMVPICTHGHWFLVIIAQKHRIFVVLDSLGLQHPDEIENLKYYYTMELQSKYATTVLLSQIHTIHLTDIPRQINAFDCGVFVIVYGFTFMANPVKFFDFVLGTCDSLKWNLKDDDVLKAREELQDMVNFIKEDTLA